MKVAPTDLLTSPQVAIALGVSLRTAHRLVHDGKLEPVLRLPGPNGAWLFRRTDVEKLAAKLAEKRARLAASADNGDAA